MNAFEPQRIRFRRDEIADLDTLPSASLPIRAPDIGLGRRTGKMIGSIFAALTLLVIATGAVVFALASTGLATDRVRSEAERAIEALVGVPVEVSTGPATVAADSSKFLALQVSDVKLAQAGASAFNAGQIGFGVRILPLFSGRLELGSASISNARLNLGALPASGDWAAALRNREGLISPDKVTAELFALTRRLIEAAGAGAAREIVLDDVEFVLSENPLRSLRIKAASIGQSDGGGITLAAGGTLDGRRFDLRADARPAPLTGNIETLKLRATLAPSPAARPGTSVTTLGAIVFAVEGAQAPSGGAELNASLAFEQAGVDLGKEGYLQGDVDVRATLRTNAGRVEIDRLHAETGNSVFDFSGEVQPGRGGTYDYELSSDRSIVSPADLPDAPLEVSLRLAGAFDPDSRVLTADTIGVTTSSGEAAGSAAIELPAGKSPGITLALTVPGMVIAQAKPLWPWFAAPSSRKWVLEKVAGARIVEGRIDFEVPPGRLGNGVPLSVEEISGRFVLTDGKFETAGLLPPVSEAAGIVDFRGGEVDIAMSTGRALTSSGRAVQASNATMTIRGEPGQPPMLGKLDVDIQGEAEDVAEFASLEPINALKRLGLTAKDFSGRVSGKVSTDIPLRKGIDRNSLRFQVDLNYEDLAIAKPFDGRTLSDANGAIVIEPEQARVVAQGKLNGAPARIDLLEPLRPNGPERSRKVSLSLTDKTRDAFAPGLGELVSGPFELEFSQRGEAAGQVSADLTSATLSAPWVGWSKGPGVGATVAFNTATADAVTTLSDFKLTGKTFGISGDIVLSGAALSSARLSSVRLNRDDDIAVDVKKSGKAYAVDIQGETLDARALIKRFAPKDESGPKQAEMVPVSVKADISRVTGFGGETLRNLTLAYSGVGSKTTSFRLRAVAGSGGAVSASKGSAAGRRGVSMQAADAGAMLRFLDLYGNLEGGEIDLTLAEATDGSLRGQVDARNFVIVDEPRLSSIVSTPPPGSDRSLKQIAKKDIDTSRVQFERGFAQIVKGPNSLEVANGVLRGPTIGTTFQGVLYDRNGQMQMTGTFMPAYGLNRLFGEVPLIGAILGNGRDRGLIGVTYKLEGEAKSPQVSINPFSAIAPGIFRSIFEY